MRHSSQFLLSILLSSQQLAVAQHRCGSDFGGATCADGGFPTYCCSSAGWCGTTDAYCGTGCVSMHCLSFIIDVLQSSSVISIILTQYFIKITNTKSYSKVDPAQVDPPLQRLHLHRHLRRLETSTTTIADRIGPMPTSNVEKPAFQGPDVHPALAMQRRLLVHQCTMVHHHHHLLLLIQHHLRPRHLHPPQQLP